MSYLSKKEEETMKIQTARGNRLAIALETIKELEAEHSAPFTPRFKMALALLFMDDPLKFTTSLEMASLLQEAGLLREEILSSEIPPGDRNA